MRRSTVGCIVTLALSLLVMALAATAQPAGKVHRIGELRGGAPPTGTDPMAAAFRQGLRDLGYVEGQNLVIEYRSAEGRADRLPHLAAELVRLQVEVIVAGGSAAVRAVQQATRTIPIVIVGGDPVADGRRVWMAMALAIPSRLWLGGVISPQRDRVLITTLVQMIRACGRSLAILVCVDGLTSDVTAFLRVFRQPIRTGRRGRPRLVPQAGLRIGQVVKR